MIVAHVLGLPIEESVLTLTMGGTGVSALAFVALARARRVLRGVGRRSPGTGA